MCNVVIKPAKCKVAKHEVKYLGNIIENGQVKSMQSYIDKVHEQKLLETITDVRAFYNMAGFYRKYIKNFAKIAKPLTDSLPGKKKKIQLTLEAIKAFLELKEKLNESPVLVFPDFNKPFGLRTNASKYVIGAVLFQLNENGEKQPIAYGSRVISKTKQRYSALERKMLAIYYFIRNWRAYLMGGHFNVYTDHSPLRSINTRKDASRRLTRMILNLQEYDFELFYTLGKENVMADVASRNPIANYNEGIVASLVGWLLSKQNECSITWYDVVICGLYGQEHISKKILEHPVQKKNFSWKVHLAAGQQTWV